MRSAKSITRRSYRRRDLASPAGRLCLFATACLGLAGCAGYRVGAGTLYRPDVQTVAVNLVESDSFRPFLGERLTEAVVRELQTQTPYRIAPASTAQSFLQVRIVNDTKRVIGENANDEPRVLQVGMRANVTWTNRLGQSLMTRQIVVLDEFEAFIPEGGQSMVTVQQDIIDDLAQRIVATLEADW